MRKTLRLLVAILVMSFVLPQTVFAQDKTISGTVLGEDKAPLAGVTIRVKGTRRITQTDANGNFSIKVNPGETLVASYVGFEEQEVKTGDGSVVGITLKSSEGTMGEVVVTAMDLKRSKRSLGYSVQTVSGDDVKETQRENFINSLQGRIAGATVTSSSGVAGASSSIVLRGFNSLSMSNQPLFVVAGVIMDNQTIDENSDGGRGVGMVDRTGLTNNANRNSDYQNRIADINPNDIESITVLKGPEATALYGSQASSGAIVITTKKAKTNKFGLQYDNSFRASFITRLPELMNGYQPGTNGYGSNIFRYFGPAYPEGTTYYDNINNFFRTGITQTHNIGMDFGVKNSIFRVSGSYLNQSGVLPANGFKRYNGRISNTTKVGKWLEIMPAFSYSHAENDKVLASAAGYMASLVVFPSTFDIRQFVNANGDKIPVFSENANGEFDNPYFSVTKNRTADETDRYTSSLGININPTKWLSLSGRFGYDMYQTTGYTRYHPLSYFLGAAQGGSQENFYRKYANYNHNITATVRKSVGDFSMRLMGGTMWQDSRIQMFSVYGTGLVDSVVNGVMYKGGVALTDGNFNQYVPQATDSNATKASTRQRLLRNSYGEYNLQDLRQLAYFGEFQVSWKNLVFLTYSHRFEESSTLPKQNRRYNYPAGSVSIILSDLIPAIKTGGIISYMKLRTSLASTARLNTPYSTQSVFVNATASGGGFSYGFTNANDALTPERQKTYEVGTELKLFKDKISLDATYYNTLNVDQIIENFRLSYATGFVLNTQNTGSTRNQGVEFSLNMPLVKRKAFRWDMTFNFNKMWNRVEKLPANVSEYYIADTWVYLNARGGIMMGQPTTTITSFGYARNNAGQILINPASGLPVIDGTFKIHGDRNPSFTLGWVNNVSYKNFKLNFLWDLKVGGDIFNATLMEMTNRGRSYLTADRYKPRVIEGVLNDGKQNSATPTKNTIVVTPAYLDEYYTSTGMPEEAFIEKDVNWFRLRDVTLSYVFPQTFTKRVPGLKNFGLFLTVNDLVLMTNYSGPDPASNGNTAGTRGVGGFGFDYYKLPSPVQYNFGLRAGF